MILKYCIYTHVNIAVASSLKTSIKLILHPNFDANVKISPLKKTEKLYTLLKIFQNACSR